MRMMTKSIALASGLLLFLSTAAVASYVPLRVQEQDGTPSATDIDTIKVSNGTLTDDGSGTVSINTTASIGADSLNFTDFSDTMSLDASTSVAFGANNLTLNLDSTGDFIVQDNGTAFLTASDSGEVMIGSSTDLGAYPLQVTGDTKMAGKLLVSDGVAPIGLVNDIGVEGTANTDVDFALSQAGRGTLTITNKAATSIPSTIEFKSDVASPFVFVNSGTTETMRIDGSGNVSIASQGDLRLQDDTGGEYVALQAPTGTTTHTLTLPAANGSGALTNNGSGTLSWAAATVGADSLDFTDFKDAMTLDASTDIAVTGSNALSITNTGSGNSLLVNDSASDTTPFVIDTNGNVGVGISAPTRKLYVYKSNAGDYFPQILMEEGQTDGYAQISFVAPGSEWHYGTGGSAESAQGVAKKFFIWDQNASAHRFKIDEFGRVEIPNDTLMDTGSLLDVNLTLGNDANVDTISAINVDVTSATTGDADILYGLNVNNLSSAAAVVTETAIHTGTGWENAAIFEAGNVAIGNTNPQAALHVGPGTDASLDPATVVATFQRNGATFLSVRDASTDSEGGIFADSGYVSVGSFTGSTYVGAGNNIIADVSGNVNISNGTLGVGTGNKFEVNNSTGDVTKIKSVAYAWPAANGSGALTNNGSGTLSWAAATVGADSLNFTDFADTMALDASTTIGFGAGALSLTFNNNGSADEIHNLSSTGDFQVQDNGATFMHLSDTGGFYYTLLAATNPNFVIDNLGIGDVIFKSQGNSTMRFNGDGSLVFSPTGIQDSTFSFDADSNNLFTGTIASDATINAVDITMTDNASASTGALYPFHITNADNSTNTGVPDALARLVNANAAETVPAGMVIEQTGAGTMTSALKITQTAGTITNAIDANGTLISLAELQRLDGTTGALYNAGGTDVAVSDGGTGLSTLTANNVILGNGASAPLFVAPGTSGNVLTSNGTTWTSTAPSGGTNWDAIGDAGGNGAIAMGSTVQTMDWGTADTQAALTLNANALTTGELLTLAHTTSVIADGGSLARISSTSADTGGATNGVLLDLSSTASTSGTQFLQTYSGLTTGTGEKIVGNALSSGTLLDISSNGTAALTNQKGLNISMAGTNSNAGQTTYGGYISNAHAGTGATVYGLYGNATAASTNSSYGLYGNAGTTNGIAYGVYGVGASTGGSGSAKGYGGYFSATTVDGTAGAVYATASASGIGAAYAGIFAAGNVGIGDTTPASLLTVGSGDLFQVDSSGDMVKIKNISYLWPSSQGGASTVLTNNGSGTLSWASGSSLISGLGAAGAANTINNTNYQQEWQWNTLGAGSGLKLSSTSTAAASNTQKLFEVNLSGANATSTQTTYGGYFSNAHTGTSSSNIGLYASASGGTASIGNIAGYFEQTASGFSPAVYLKNNDTGTQSYTQLGFEGTGSGARTFGIGVANGSETANGIANKFFIYDFTGTTIREVIDSNGNMGLGTTNPAKRLEINSSTGADLRLTYNDADGSAVNYTDFSVGSTGSLTVAPAGTNPDIILTPGGTGAVVMTNPLLKGEKVTALTDAATVATDAATGNIFTISSAVGRTLGAPTNPTNGQKCIWRWKNTSGGAITHTLTTGSAGSFRFGTTVSNISATPSGKTDYIGAIYNLTDDRWDVIAYSKGY